MIGVMLSDVIRTDKNEQDEFIKCDVVKRCDIKRCNVKRCSMPKSHLIATSRQLVCMHKSDH